MFDGEVVVDGADDHAELLDEEIDVALDALVQIELVVDEGEEPRQDGLDESAQKRGLHLPPSTSYDSMESWGRGRLTRTDQATLRLCLQPLVTDPSFYFKLLNGIFFLKKLL